jgi:putative ABC transport system permease protein
LLLHHLIYEKVIMTHFGGRWNMPVTSVAVVLLLVSASCVAAVYAPSKRIQGMAVTETINEL